MMLVQQVNPLLILLLAALIMLSLMALMPWLFSLSRSRSKAVREEVVELVGCPKCGHEYSRKYERGSYVGKEVGACPRGDGPLVVKAIYVERHEGPE